jgi:hypothetical protein
MLAYKLLNDLRNGASTQPRTPRQLSARDGLAGPDQLENDIAIDDPRGLARRELQFRQIDMSYSMPVTPQFRLTSATKHAISRFKT